ncbi:MAG: DUF4097 domain-containing protein [Treponema sp.]|nr:DUF4097 domain-containing protein [Treponema sp.]
MKTKIKKIISTLFLTFNCLLLLSAGSFEERKSFKTSSVSTIEVELLFQNLTLSTYNGDEILLITESNKKDNKLQISLEKDNLQIREDKNAADKKSVSTISLMLPENYLAEYISIKAPYGNLDIKKLNAKNVSLVPGPENSLANITADYFEIPMPGEADMNISNLTCKAFKITLVAGNANLSLAKAPEKDSELSIKDGNINLQIPENSDFTILADSYHSKFINNYNGSVEKRARDGLSYKHNKGGATIKLKTFEGDITIGE